MSAIERDVTMPERVAPGHYLSRSTEATRRLGELLGGLLGEGDLVILTGDLGAGTTQLTKGVARALGVADEVVSPTFNLMVPHRGRELDLYHLDLYRLEDEGQLGDAGALDVAGVEGVSLVEWGEAYAEALGDERLDITITRLPVDRGEEPARSVVLEPHGERAERILEGLDRSLAEVGRP